TFTALIGSINGIVWHDYALLTLLGVGILFTLWSGFGQYRALTHGVAVVRGKYDDTSDPGAINHFQALSTALSATVGLGNRGRRDRDLARRSGRAVLDVGRRRGRHGAQDDRGHAGDAVPRYVGPAQDPH